MEPGANAGYRYASRVPAAADGSTLLDFLTARYRHSTRESWRRRIDEGRVEIDGKPAEASRSLRAGQLVAWNRPPWVEPPVPAGFAVLYRDEDLLVVAKPSGTPTLPGAGYLESSLLHQVRRLDPAASPMHRLGRGTSGLLLCARTPTARAAVGRDWREGRVYKRYRALAAGDPADDRFQIDRPIARVPHPLLGSVWAAGCRGRASHTTVRVVERRAGAFLADVEIATGRPHQIRIHLAAAGHPLLGDPLYPAGGIPGADCRALPGDLGYRLHSAELRLTHPRSGEPITWRCAPPRGLRPGCAG